MKRYYDKTTHNMVFVESDSTILWEELSQEFLDYANNLQDLSYEVSYDTDGMPVVKRLQLDEDGNRYSHYLEDGSPDLVAIEDYKAYTELQAKIQEAKIYLANTDYKMLPNYVSKVDEDLDAIIAKRNETREFIRNNNA